jgi:hypothetical protein
VMENAVREPLGAATTQSSDAGMARASQFLQITKRAIVVAIPHGSIESESARQQALSSLRAEPRSMAVTLITPPFEVKGTVHLRRLFHVRQAMDDLKSEFIPLTDAEVSYLPDPRVRTSAELLVANRNLAEIFTGTAEGGTSPSRGFRSS